ncbi:LysR family transcriptional regulator [Oceanobacillus alkalisoli]|uniref:LysR family transcriptional regulator n=1 Tax=Oceanobacillus alkalisoli TaxID=2925113 RepID=UPI001F120C12|nr:LysR substrate-binding domain-containing protein [Oceanobacillus alkalisoli]
MLFKNYEYFLAIVEEGGLTRAAERLYITQPSLSKYLKRLEMNLGVELFDRSSSPLKLTYMGERYYTYIMQIMTLDKQIQKEFSEIQANERGKVKIGLALWRGTNILPDILPTFSSKYPNIEVSITEGKSDFLVNELLSERLDFAIMNLPTNMDFTKLTYDTLIQEQILLAGNKNHELVKEAESIQDDSNGYLFIDTARLVNELFIITKTGQNLTKAILQHFSKRHLDPKNILEIENLTTAINLVSAGMGFTFIPEIGAKEEHLPENISIFTVNDPVLIWPLAIVYKKDTYTTKVSNLLINMLKERYQLNGGRNNVF